MLVKRRLSTVSSTSDGFVEVFIEENVTSQPVKADTDDDNKEPTESSSSANAGIIENSAGNGENLLETNQNILPASTRGAIQ